MNQAFKLLLFISSIIINTSNAAVHTVKMLNSGADGFMVFEPAVMKISVGDTINFEATDMAHNSASIAGMIPAGAKPWNGLMSRDISVKFEKEGIYVYQCTPHLLMAMVGVIQVGESKENFTEIKAIAEKKKSLFVTNKDRLNNYLLQL